VLTQPPAERGFNFALNGNLLLDELFGARVSFVEPKADLNRAIEVRARSLRQAGHRVSAVPVGGSNGLGSLGYVVAALEIAADLAALRLHVDRILLATGSAGTQAGLLVGLALAGLSVPVDGISVGARMDRQRQRVLDCINEVELLLTCGRAVPADSIRVHDEFVGQGYGEVTDACHNAIHLQ
jgi:L-cysteate sulfo-lyase